MEHAMTGDDLPIISMVDFSSSLRQITRRSPAYCWL